MTAGGRLGVLQPGDPEQVGPFVIRARIGAGGMGDVYLAEAAVDRPVALRVLMASWANDAASRGRFRRDVEVARGIRSPVLAAVVDADPDAARPWVAHEYVEGFTLHEVVEAGILPLAVAIAIVSGVAEAITAVHQAGIIHGNLKPSTILCPPNAIKIIDVGLAAALAAPSASTAADVFGWGCLAVYALTGRRVDGSDVRPDLRGIPNGLLELVSAALANRPEDRPSAGDIRAMLVPTSHPSSPVGQRQAAEGAGPPTPAAPPSDVRNEPTGPRTRRTEFGRPQNPALPSSPWSTNQSASLPHVPPTPATGSSRPAPSETPSPPAASNWTDAPAVVGSAAPDVPQPPGLSPSSIRPDPLSRTPPSSPAAGVPEGSQSPPPAVVALMGAPPPPSSVGEASLPLPSASTVAAVAGAPTPIAPVADTPAAIASATTSPSASGPAVAALAGAPHSVPPLPAVAAPSTTSSPALSAAAATAPTPFLSNLELDDGPAGRPDESGPKKKSRTAWVIGIPAGVAALVATVAVVALVTSNSSKAKVVVLPTVVPPTSTTTPATTASTGTSIAGGIAPLTLLLAQDVNASADCTHDTSPPGGLIGLTNALICSPANLPGGQLFAFQFDNSKDYATSLVALDKFKGFDPSTAGSVCPPGPGEQGLIGWHSNLFPSQQSQFLECLSVGTADSQPDYVWTYPSDNAFIDAQAAERSSFVDLDDWWARGTPPQR